MNMIINEKKNFVTAGRLAGHHNANKELIDK